VLSQAQRTEFDLFRFILASHNASAIEPLLAQPKSNCIRRTEFDMAQSLSTTRPAKINRKGGGNRDAREFGAIAVQ
jgi:hypothetical protein